MVKDWIFKRLERHPKVVGVGFLLGFYLMSLIEPTCADCTTTGP